MVDRKVVLPSCSGSNYVCLRKLEHRPDPATMRREVERLLLAFPVLPLTGPVVLEALWGAREHLLSYYDAQIWPASVLGRWSAQPGLPPGGRV